MRDVYIADRNVGHLAHWTNVGLRLDCVLVLGGEQNGVAGLAEATPDVFHEIRFDQYPNRILQFKMVLDDEGVAVGSADEVRVAGHPLQRFKEMIVQDLDVGRARGSASAPEQDGFARSLQEIVLNLEGAILRVADASANRMSVGTSPRPRDAMEIAKVGVDDRCVTHAIEVHATASFILRISMQPGTVYHEVIHRAAKSAGDPDQAV